MTPAERIAAALAGRYRFERELGRGGMATVWLAEDVRHHRRVAIKVLHPELSAVLGPERFLKEIELTAGLQHPHILPLFDSGECVGPSQPRDTHHRDPEPARACPPLARRDGGEPVQDFPARRAI